ncbi:MAG: LysR family transcriptional regulator, partial [Fusobacterium mortiferum]
YKVNDVKDGYQAVITKDKKSLIQIIKFINFIQDYKIQY